MTYTQEDKDRHGLLNDLRLTFDQMVSNDTLIHYFVNGNSIRNKEALSLVNDVKYILR